jgi:hypothetical protein
MTVHGAPFALKVRAGLQVLKYVGLFGYRKSRAILETNSTA